MAMQRAMTVPRYPTSGDDALSELRGASEWRWLVAAGIVLFVVGLSNGFVIHSSPLPRLSLSAHLVALMGAGFLLALGALWPRLNLSRRLSRAGSVLAVYGFAFGWMIYYAAAELRAGGMFPLMSGTVRAAPALEQAISLALLTVALALIGLCGIVLAGLRGSR